MRAQDVSVRFGPFELDTSRHLLLRDGREVHLTPKAFELLRLLVEAAPGVVPKAELHRRLWQGGIVTDATLVGLVKELRRGLDDHNPEAPLIRTAHRVGYAFSQPIAPASPSPPLSHWIVIDDRRIPLGEGENRIGRDPQSIVCLDHPCISRHHARILVTAARAVLEDVGSKNGTAVGATPVNGNCELHDGDHLSFGSVVAVFRSSVSGTPTVTQFDVPPGLPRSFG
jgi:DNA-binding winged helix-turn-helix (wHTH) protein